MGSFSTQTHQKESRSWVHFLHQYSYFSLDFTNIKIKKEEINPNLLKIKRLYGGVRVDDYILKSENF